MAPIPELTQIRKNQIMDASLRTMAQTGCANATMEDIARAAGLSKGGLAHYYKSKNELFVAVFETFFERIFIRSRITMDKTEGPLEKLLCFGFLFDLDDPDTRIGYPILFDCMAIAIHEKEYRRMFGEWVDNWIVLLTSAIRLGMDQGIFKNMDPDPVARLISAIYQGVATRWYLAGDSHSTEWALNSFQTAIRQIMKPYMVKSE